MAKKLNQGRVLPENVLKQFDAKWEHKPVAVDTPCPACAVRPININRKWKAHLSNRDWMCEINMRTPDYCGLLIHPLAIKYYCKLNGKYGPWRVQCALNFLTKNGYDTSLEKCSKYLDGTLWENVGRTSAEENIKKKEAEIQEALAEDEPKTIDDLIDAICEKSDAHEREIDEQLPKEEFVNDYYFRHALEEIWNTAITRLPHGWRLSWFTSTDVSFSVDVSNSDALGDLLNAIEHYDVDDFAQLLISKEDYAPTDAVDAAREVRVMMSVIHDGLLSKYADPRVKETPEVGD